MSDIPWYPYAVDEAVPRDISTVERGLGAISRAPLIPEVRLSLQKSARRRSSRGSAAIEGITIDTASLQAMDRGLAPGTRSEREIAALMHLYDWIQEHGPGYVIGERDLKTLHQLVWDKIITKSLSGRYRHDPVGVWDGSRLVHEAPPAKEVAMLMRAFGKWLGALGSSTLHPVLAAGIAQFQLIRIHPYMDGNGRCSRGLSALIVRCADSDAGGLLAHEDQILRGIDGFYRPSS
jgi:Fic family protein